MLSNDLAIWLGFRSKVISQWVDCMAETWLTLFLCIHWKKVFFYPIFIAYSSNRIVFFQTLLVYKYSYMSELFKLVYSLIKTITVVYWDIPWLVDLSPYFEVVWQNNSTVNCSKCMCDCFTLFNSCVFLLSLIWILPQGQL